MEQREVEIDLIDFMFEVLSHWRGFLACILIGAVLGGGYSALKSVSAETPEAVAATAEDYAQELSESELRDVDTVMQFDALMKEYHNDPILSMDANEVPAGSITFNITASNPIDTKSIVTMVYRLLNSPEFYAYVTEQENYTGDVSRLFYDIYSTTSESDMVSAVYTLAGNSKETGHYGFVELRFFGPSEEFCEQVVKDAESFVQSKSSAAEAVYGDYNIEVVASSVNTVKDQQVATLQMETLDAYATAKTSRDGMVKVFTEDQKSYYEALAADEAEENEAVTTVSAPRISKKLIVVGAFGFIVLYGMYLFVIYAFSGRWQAYNSYHETYGLNDLGMIRGNQDTKKNALDAAIAKARMRGVKALGVDEAVDVLTSAIALQAEKEEIHSLALVGANHGEATEQQVQALRDALEKKNSDVKVRVLYDVAYNATSIDQLSEVDAVVLIETASKSRVTEITKEILLLNNQKIRILGGVTI